MKKSIWNKRIPSILGLLFLVFSTGAFIVLGGNLIDWRGRATTDETPKNIAISNITDKSFTVSFSTDGKVLAGVAYGSSDKFGSIALDNRDRESVKPAQHNIHYITIDGLNPDTKYFFAIQSGARSFLDGQVPYEIKTGITLPENTTAREAVTGSVNLPDGNIPLEGIVYLETDNSQKLSALLRIDGAYNLPISSLRSSDLATLLELDGQTELLIIAHGASLKSTVKTVYENTNPVPLVNLSKDYDFTAEAPTPAEDLTASVSAEKKSSESGSLTLPVEFPEFSTDVASGPAILTPVNGQKFDDQQPLFEGTGLPNSDVSIIIQSTTEIRATVSTDSKGSWQYRPDEPLPPGEHAISIETQDKSGILQKITRSFVVHAEGSQFNEPSVSPIGGLTPSISPSPTLTPTQIPLPTLTPTLTASQSSQLTPTIDPNLIATPNLALTGTALTGAALTGNALSATIDPAGLTATAKAAKAGIPASGNYTFLIFGLVTALSLAGGIMLFFL